MQSFNRALARWPDSMGGALGFLAEIWNLPRKNSTTVRNGNKAVRCQEPLDSSCSGLSVIAPSWIGVDHRVQEKMVSARTSPSSCLEALGLNTDSKWVVRQWAQHGLLTLHFCLAHATELNPWPLSHPDTEPLLCHAKTHNHFFFWQIKTFLDVFTR